MTQPPSFPSSELLVQALFKPGSTINPDHKEKYVYILAYAASVYNQVCSSMSVQAACPSSVHSSLPSSFILKPLMNRQGKAVVTLSQQS